MVIVERVGSLQPIARADAVAGVAASPCRPVARLSVQSLECPMMMRRPHCSRRGVPLGERVLLSFYDLSYRRPVRTNRRLQRKVHGVLRPPSPFGEAHRGVEDR